MRPAARPPARFGREAAGAPVVGGRPGRPRWSARFLAASGMLTLATAPIEGYLQTAGDWTAKVAPALFIGSWALSRATGRHPVRAGHAVVWCSLGLAVLVLLSAATNLATNPFVPLYVLRWLPYLALVVALTDTVGRELPVWHALWSIVAGTSLAAVGALYGVLVEGDVRAAAPLTDPNDLAYALTAAVPIALVAARSAPARAPRRLALAALLVTSVAAVATLSRGGALALVAVAAWALLRGVVRLRHLAIAVLAAAVCASAVLLVRSDEVAEALGAKRYVAGDNVQTRLLRWEASLRMLGDHLALGVGPGGFRSSYVWYGSLAELDELTPVNHNMYLEVGAELGLLGLGVFLGLLLSAVAATGAAHRRWRGDPVRSGPHPDRSAAALAVQGALLAVAVSSSFLSEQYFLALWALVAIAAALDLESTRRSR